MQCAVYWKHLTWFLGSEVHIFLVACLFHQCMRLPIAALKLNCMWRLFHGKIFYFNFTSVVVDFFQNCLFWATVIHVLKLQEIMHFFGSGIVLQLLIFLYPNLQAPDSIVYCHQKCSKLSVTSDLLYRMP